MSKMVPVFPSEASYGAVLDLPPTQTTQGCIDCLLGGKNEPLGRVYVVSGTVFCAGHAITARQKELENAS